MGDLTAIGETRDDDGSGLTLSVGLETARRRTQTLFFPTWASPEFHYLSNEITQFTSSPRKETYLLQHF
jgi:hypothetical protein